MKRTTFLAAVLLCVATLQPTTHAEDQAYKLVDGWGPLPAGVTWGEVPAMTIDQSGRVLAFHRNEPNVIEFDASGKVLKTWGSGFVYPHGIRIDRNGFLWLTDARGQDGKGQQIFKYTREGKLLMTIGTAGKSGEEPDAFNGPTDVAVAPNGDIFISDGHVNSRIVKFSKDGKFIKAWGKPGKAQGEFNQPHGIALDSAGRVYVGDRGNGRVQIFDPDGNFIAEWKQFGLPSGIYIDRNDVMYVADTQSDQARNPGFKRGVRIGSVKDGKVTAFIPEPSAELGTGEGVAADDQGNVFQGYNSKMAVRRFVKN
jgi:DNA-binding beta-propeller fold protein YncE